MRPGDSPGAQGGALVRMLTPARWKHSMPQYEVGHLERVKRISEHVSNLQGLQLAGNAYTGPGIPDCIRSGTSAADQLLNSQNRLR